MELGESSTTHDEENASISHLKSLTLDELSKYINDLRFKKSEAGVPDPAESPPNWLEDGIGAPSLWSPTINYTECKFCLNCMVSVAILAGEYKKRGTPEFPYEGLREVNTLYHIDPSKMADDYTPIDILNEAIEGCPLCALAIGTSWHRGEQPFDSARWAKNPLWRKRAQTLHFNMYRRVPLNSDYPKAKPLCQIIYGTNLTTDLWPEADMSEFWGAIHLWTQEELAKWYDENKCAYTLEAELGPPPLFSICSSTSDLEALCMGLWWLKRCQGEHKSCSEAGKQTNDADSPSRLLYVGTKPEYDDVKLFINDGEMTPEYVTLSYCWGKKEFPRLTEETLPQFLESIDVNTLPATLKDAVEVTRLLGYSYIWIDALCIIQGSKADWLLESRKMGSIYRKSVVTIAALGGADCFQGLFTARNPLCYTDLPLSNSPFVFSKRAGNVDPGPKREFEVIGPAASALQTRAWCVQEQLLSPRTLFFGSSGIFWQCIECHADEGFPVGTKVKEPNLPNLKNLLNLSLTSPNIDVRVIWREVLERYTGCKLTYASDKLVAISGIAQLLAETSGKEYIQGLWKENIWRDLLWHTADPKWTNNRRLQRLENECPTFSWASVAQPIRYFKRDYPESNFLDAKSVVVETNEKDECQLRISTQLRAVVLLPPAYSQTGMPCLMLASTCPFPVEQAWDSDEVPLEILARIQENVRYDFTIDKKTDEDVDTSKFGPFTYEWIPDIPLDGTLTRAFFMCLSTQDMYDPPGTAGLIIVPMNEERTTWKRIGFLFHTGFFKSWKETGLRLTVQNTANNEINWEETAKCRAPNPFLLGAEEDCCDVVLV